MADSRESDRLVKDGRGQVVRSSGKGVSGDPGQAWVLGSVWPRPTQQQGAHAVTEPEARAHNPNTVCVHGLDGTCMQPWCSRQLVCSPGPHLQARWLL